MKNQNDIVISSSINTLDEMGKNYMYDYINVCDRIISRDMYNITKYIRPSEKKLKWYMSLNTSINKIKNAFVVIGSGYTEEPVVLSDELYVPIITSNLDFIII